MAKETEARLKEIVGRRVELFKRKPEAAVYRPKVSSRHINGLYTETTVREHTLKIDYAEPAGGSNQGPNPIEVLLAALAACIESAFYEFAAYEGIRIDSLSVDVEGMLDLRGLFMVDESVPAGFQDLRYTFDILSPDDEQRIRVLAEKVVAHCPVVDSLTRPVNISGEININKENN